MIDPTGTTQPVMRFRSNEATAPSCEFSVRPGETYSVTIANIDGAGQVSETFTKEWSAG